MTTNLNGGTIKKKDCLSFSYFVMLDAHGGVIILGDFCHTSKLCCYVAAVTMHGRKTLKESGGPRAG